MISSLLLQALLLVRGTQQARITLSANAGQASKSLGLEHALAGKQSAESHKNVDLPSEIAAFFPLIVDSVDQAFEAAVSTSSTDSIPPKLRNTQVLLFDSRISKREDVRAQPPIHGTAWLLDQ